MKLDFPFLVEPSQLEMQLGHSNLLVVDVGDRDAYDRERIPGAAHVDYLDLVSGEIPTSGTLPSAEQLQAVISSIGLKRDTHVVAYDSEGNGRAARFLWTLDVLDHPASSLLNGGFTAWKNEWHPIDTAPSVNIEHSNYPITINGKSRADKSYILSNLGKEGFGLLDARSQLEFEGIDIRAAQGGHIPGARNINWTDTIDANRNNRLKPPDVLRQMLYSQGLTPDMEIITYCQTHHRSSHSYAMLKSLGFEKIRGYPGSWAEWGNSLNMPIERTQGANNALLISSSTEDHRLSSTTG